MRIRHFLALAAVTLLTAFGPPERTTPQKWAVVVGISDYIHFGDEVGGDLPGAVNDARAIADVLVNRHGFAPENVKLVLDHDATRNRIQTELAEWLPSVARPGDLIWFYFAGHGSQAWDMDGDEEDGLDETVCPADVMRGNTEMDILDDEVGVWLGQLPTENVVVVWDKCHAKSSTRAVTPFARPRSLARAVEQDVARPADATAGRTTDAPEDGGGLGTGVLEIAAAQADEVAIDAAFPGASDEEPTYGGAFTTPFVENLWNADADATYSEIFEATREAMRRERFRQQPHLDDKVLKDRALFWVEGIEEEDADAAHTAGGNAARILERTSAARVVLSGGTNADMTTGSVYRSGRDLLEVLDVSGDRATARVLADAAEPTADDTPAGAARLLAHRYPDASLRVAVNDLPADVRGALGSRLDHVSSLRLIEDGTSFAHLLVRPRSGHYVVLSLDGFARDSVAANAAAPDALAELIRREYGQYQLAELENPARPFDLAFSFGNGRNDFVLGESLTFHVTSERSGYLTIVDLAPDGTVTVIFPNEYVAENRVHAGRIMQFPTAGSDLQFGAIEPTGRGVVRAFVTEQPLELPFTQSDDATDAARIWTALREAAGQSPVEGSVAMPVQSWATAAIVYEIRRE